MYVHLFILYIHISMAQMWRSENSLQDLFFYPQCGSWEVNQGNQARQQVPLPTELSY